MTARQRSDAIETAARELMDLLHRETCDPPEEGLIDIAVDESLAFDLVSKLRRLTKALRVPKSVDEPHA